MRGFRGFDTPELGRRLSDDRYDAVLVSGWNARTYWQAMIGCWRSATPLLVRGDSQLLPWPPLWKRILKRLLYPLFIGRIDACLAVGSRSEAYFRHYGARRVVRVPHFVDNAAFGQAAAAARARRTEIRSSWGAGDDDLVALFAGKFIPEKQPQDFARAIAQLSGEPIVGVFVGEGALRPECESIARETGARVHFDGFRNQTRMAEAYAAADVLVLPSHSETWGLVVNEAMAAGLPGIVSEAVGCAPDLVLDGRTGFVYPTGNVVALAECIRRASDPRLRARLAAEAREHVQAFSVRTAVHGVLEACGLVVR
jgi:glycosyltransferase involved in cell wall biosynthesis